MPESIAYNVDCMEYLRSVPDNYFDLAVVDPPYGDASSQNGNVERERERARGRGRTGSASAGTSTNTGQWNRFGAWFDRYKYPPQEPLYGQVVHGQANTGKKSSRGT